MDRINMINQIESLVKDWGDRPKLYIVAAGCGWTLSRLLEIPGASKVVDEIRLLYSKESWEGTTCGLYPITKDFKFVSPEGLQYLSQRFETRPETINIALTASLPSNYAKRSQNQAFGRVGKETFHVHFSNSTTREEADIIIMENVIDILNKGNI